MKRKLVSFLLVAAMTASSLSVASASSLEMDVETYVEDAAEFGTVETETEVPITSELETEETEMSADETVTDTQFPDVGYEYVQEEENQTEVQTEVETEEEQKQVVIKADNADVFFASDLKKLKDGILEDPDLEKDPVPQTEADTPEKREKRAEAIKEAAEILPDEYVRLLTDNAYQLLMKQEHKFDVSTPVDFYIVPENGYEIDTVKALSAQYGELQVIDFENGVYEITIPSDDITLDIKTKESEKETEPESSTEAEVETETDAEIETETEAETETETSKEEHFLEKAEGTDSLDATKFASQRLVVLSSDNDIIMDPEHLIGQYGNISLLHYSSVEQTMNAYVYYLGKAEAVEPDTVITAASDETSIGNGSETQPELEDETSAEIEEIQVETEADVPADITATEIDNPIAALAGEQDSAVVQAEKKVIALLDTGADGSNVIDQVSMIDGGLVGSSTHGANMVDAITEQNPEAKILSVRVLGDDNLGTISSIVAGMEYAISQNVDFINLSLYARKSLSNSVLESEIQKAEDAGIEVVGAAGNDGADVINYMPGSVESAWIIGACDERGVRIDSSNYGATVDYNVVGSSTSVATAKFTGYISANGTKDISSDIIFTTAGEPSGKEDVSNEDEKFAVAGQKVWGTDGIPFTTACTSFTTAWVDKIDIYGNSGGSKNGGWVWCDQNKTMEVYLKNAGLTYIDSTLTALDVKILVTPTTQNGIAIHKAYSSDGKKQTITIGNPWSYSDDKRPSGISVATLEFYFYKSNTQYKTPLTLSGTGQFLDIDSHEGIAFIQGGKDLYLNNPTWIYGYKFNSSSATYYTTSHETGGSANDDSRQNLQYTFTSSASKPLTIRYWAGDHDNIRAVGFDRKGIKINYHLISANGGTVPSSAKTPGSIFLAQGADTAGGKSVITNRYTNVAGYTFSGWKTDNQLKGTFSGSSCQKTNVNLYATYYEQKGSLTINKTITGGPTNFTANMPANKRKFTFTLEGTSTSGKTVKKTATVYGNDSATISDIPVGTYTLTETDNSDYWTCTSNTNNKQSVTIKNNGTATANFTNAVATGNITVTKVTANANLNAIPLSQKTFRFRLYGTNYGVSINETKTLVGSGSVTFSNMPVGRYTLEEIYDDDVWTSSAESQVVIIKKGDNITRTIINTYNESDQPAPTKSFDGVQGIESKKLNKTSDSVTFSIFQNVESSNSATYTVTGLQFYDGLDKAFSVDGYKLYSKNTEDEGSTWNEVDKSSILFDMSEIGTDEYDTVSVSVMNVDQSVSSLYRLDITCKIKDGFNLDDYLTNVDGEDLYVIPNKATTSFHYNTGDESRKNTNKVEVQVPFSTGSLRVSKKIDATDSPEDIIDALEYYNSTALDFEFQLYGTSDSGASVNETQKVHGTDSILFENIPTGTYTLKESYYDEELWTPSEVTQTVTIEGDVTKEVTVTNTFIPEKTPQPAPVKSLNKESSEQKRLTTKQINSRSEEVTFSIFQQVKASAHDVVAPVMLTVNDVLDPVFEYRGFQAYVSTDAGASWTEDMNFTDNIDDSTNTISLYKEKEFFSSAEWYRFDITVIVGNNANLDDYVQNIDGTNFYVIPNTASTTFTYDSRAEITQNTNTVNVRMPLDELSIEVEKTNEVTGENISNAEFTVYEWDGTAYNICVGEMNYEIKANGTGVYKMLNLHKTDTNQGKFKIIETVTPYGHVGSWSKEVVVGTNAIETYEATNPMGMGTVTVLKKGKNEEVLAGAVYSIKAKENIVSPQGKVLVNAGTEVDKVTTGKDGKAISKELYPGKYTVTEINAPQGYALDPTPQDVEVKYKDKDTSVTNTSVTFVNERLYSTITVTKDIDYSDIVWEHGNPTFTFKVDGTDILGNSHTYYETVEFTPEVQPGREGVVSKSVTFQVFAGTYTVSEEKTARYELNSIYGIVNGKVQGETAVLDVSGKKDGTDALGTNGAATFYNVKITDEDLTHTAFVKNTIA